MFIIIHHFGNLHILMFTKFAISLSFPRVLNEYLHVKRCWSVFLPMFSHCKVEVWSMNTFISPCVRVELNLAPEYMKEDAALS